MEKGGRKSEVTRAFDEKRNLIKYWKSTFDVRDQKHDNAKNFLSSSSIAMAVIMNTYALKQRRRSYFMSSVADLECNEFMHPLILELRLVYKICLSER